MNPRPFDHESGALPLSYPGTHEKKIKGYGIMCEKKIRKVFRREASHDFETEAAGI